MKIHIVNENQDCEMRDFILKQIQIEDIREQKRRDGRATMLKSIMLEDFEARLGEQQQGKKLGFKKPLTSKITCQDLFQDTLIQISKTNW